MKKYQTKVITLLWLLILYQINGQANKLYLLKHKKTGHLVYALADIHIDPPKEVLKIIPGLDQKKDLIRYADQKRHRLHWVIEDYLISSSYSKDDIQRVIKESEVGGCTLPRVYKEEVEDIFGKSVTFVYKGKQSCIKSFAIQESNLLPGLVFLLKARGLSAFNTEEDRRAVHARENETQEKLGVEFLLNAEEQEGLKTLIGPAYKPDFKYTAKAQQHLIELSRDAKVKIEKKVSNDDAYTFIHCFIKEQFEQGKKLVQWSMHTAEDKFANRVFMNGYLVDVHFLQETVQSRERNKNAFLVGGSDHIARTCQILQDKDNYQLLAEVGYEEHGDQTGESPEVFAYAGEDYAEANSTVMEGLDVGNTLHAIDYFLKQQDTRNRWLKKGLKLVLKRQRASHQ